jgi:hypothetical protein
MTGGDTAGLVLGWRGIPAGVAGGGGGVGWDHHYGGERFASSEERAKRLVAQELKRLGWDGQELTRRRKGDKHKVQLARRLRAETTMSLAWIAEQLRMGSWSYVSNLLGKAKSANSED